ncbi:MAG: hypothetical protein ABIQ52_15965, partial [Vicinamibacterales bacterium]
HRSRVVLQTAGSGSRGPAMTGRGQTRDVATAVAIGLAMFVLYNANGREIGSYDSQPTKYAARELLLRQTLSLNYVIGKTPQLMERSGFVLARDGRYRSAYSPVPAILAAAIMWPLWKAHLFDLDAPMAAALIASATSSLLVATAVALAFLTARRATSRRRAAFVAIAAGAGTGLWSTASQTLWQHETAIAGLMLAVSALTAPDVRMRQALIIGLGLGLAAASRMQLGAAVVVLIAAAFCLGGWRSGLAATAITAAIVIPVVIANLRWFGSLLGAAPMLEALHGTVHGTTESFRFQSDGFAGLLVSPSRGLLIFSPVVAFVAAGVRIPGRRSWQSPVTWCLAAATAQFVVYGSYTVWWGGHTFGPRYMLDLLPMLVPAAAVAAETVRRPGVVALAGLALAWSIAIAALGAFSYPNDAWNSMPLDVDRNHARLWDWSDNQIARAWHAGTSPQNFSLFTRDAIRAPPP